MISPSTPGLLLDTPEGTSFAKRARPRHNYPDGSNRTLTPDAFILPGIPWGAFDHLLTPAFWKGQIWQHEHLGTYRNLRLGRTLAEELTACLLRGFGMKAELGLAAYMRLKEQNLLSFRIPAATLEEALATPFLVQGHLRQYRFPAQKAKYLSACLSRIETFS